jgi:hypothetical protein
MANILVENDVFVSELRYALSAGAAGLDSVPGLLRCILKEERWRRRIIQQTGEPAPFESFVEFVTTPPLEGLGTTVKLLERICQDDPETHDLLDQAVTRGPGGDRRSEGFKHNNVMNETVQGNSTRYALRRLRRQRPDLHTQVLACEISANAAMVEAGFREKRISIPIDPERAARSILNHFDDEQVAQLIDELEGER